MLALQRFLPRIILNTKVYKPFQHRKNRSTRAYNALDMERIDRYFEVANMDVYKKMNMAEFNHFISLAVGRQMDDVDVREMFIKMDLNGDEYIAKKEVAVHLMQGLQDQSRGNLEYAFCRFDKDYDEQISLHELREALFLLGYLHAGHSNVAHFFEKKDTNHDNKIFYNEFVDIVKNDMPKFLT